MPLRSGPSWCEVGGLAGASHLLSQLGSVYIDFEQNIGLGIDGIAVDRYWLKDNKIMITMRSLLAELPVPHSKPFDLEMHIEGLKDQKYALIVNDEPPVEIVFKDFARIPMVAEPDGKLKINMYGN
jgi:hypothetical protein